MSNLLYLRIIHTCKRTKNIQWLRRCTKWILDNLACAKGFVWFTLSLQQHSENECTAGFFFTTVFVHLFHWLTMVNGNSAKRRKKTWITSMRVYWLVSSEPCERCRWSNKRGKKFVFIASAWAGSFQLFHQWPLHPICMQSQLSHCDLDAPHVVRSLFLGLCFFFCCIIHPGFVLASNISLHHSICHTIRT